MKILSHRGYWLSSAEKNSPLALSRSFQLGFGTETDVRDLGGKLIVSHDMPTGGELGWDEMLVLLEGKRLPIAVNVKSDGLADAVALAMNRRLVSDWFAFDMSVPDMRQWIKRGLPVFTRASEVERTPAYYAQAQGVWLDAFDSVWYDVGLIEGFLLEGKCVCIVSEELHGRVPQAQWEMIRSAKWASNDNVMICTDKPVDAKAFFSQ
jgi:hypothetical protein